MTAFEMFRFAIYLLIGLFTGANMGKMLVKLA